MKLKFNISKPGQKHLYFSVEQEKKEPFIYSINGKMLSCIQQSELEYLINEGKYFAVLYYLQNLCNEILDHDKIFELCNFILKTFIMEKV